MLSLNKFLRLAPPHLVVYYTRNDTSGRDETLDDALKWNTIKRVAHFADAITRATFRLRLVPRTHELFDLVSSSHEPTIIVWLYKTPSSANDYDEPFPWIVDAHISLFDTYTKEYVCRGKILEMELDGRERRGYMILRLVHEDGHVNEWAHALKPYTL